MMEGSTCSFIQLMDSIESIQIPILQRDYAQGRVEEVEVRDQFLNAIKTALLSESLTQPLDLDFVYGNFENDDESEFSVLDGQQRLTTLFLIHWYLAAKEDRLEAFRESFVAGGSSRFTYRTRTSATEFFNALALADDVFISDCGDSISDTIIDKRWFFLSWNADPTVQACLTMLDSLHMIFRDCDTPIYERLIDIETPRIVFQYLNLKSFGLSDDLYIKMNARGKPLTDFENFKAWFCGQVEHLPNGKDIEHKLDQSWTDIFWKISQETLDEFDQLYLRFFNLMAFFQACEHAEGSYDLLSRDSQNWLKKLRTSDDHIPAERFIENSSFDEVNIRRIERVLDYFHARLSEDSVIEHIVEAVTSTDYVTQLKFYALVSFLQQQGEYATWNNDTDIQISRWTRVTDNLIQNHRIDEMTPFLASARAIVEISEHYDCLYEFLKKTGMNSGFTQDQRDEEALKAQLILDDASWEPLLVQYENHSYFQGKIGFLLSMSNDGDNYSQKVFKEVADKAAQLLDDDIRKSHDFLLERALLTIDDYTVSYSSSRYSFCQSSRSTYRERSENWLRVVTKPVFKTLINKITGDLRQSLETIIANSKCGGWRQLIIDHPDTIRYCEYRMMHRDENQVYLLSKSSFRGYHVELRTFVLDKLLDIMPSEEKDKLNIKMNYNRAVYGSEMPYTYVRVGDDKIYDISYSSGSFAIVQDAGDPEKKHVDMLKKMLKNLFPNEEVKSE